jgi:hypothetical protein
MSVRRAPSFVPRRELTEVTHDNVHLTRRHARSIARMIGKLQESIEADIESVMIGDKEPEDTEQRLLLMGYRAQWLRAENAVLVLTGRKPRQAACRRMRGTP